VTTERQVDWLSLLVRDQEVLSSNIGKRDCYDWNFSGDFSFLPGKLL